jgi:hypothetical protein
MELAITLAVLAFAAALTALFGWLGARPKPLGRPRMVPWQLLMMLMAAVTMMILVHVLNLLGAHTGGQQRF